MPWQLAQGQEGKGREEKSTNQVYLKGHGPAVEFFMVLHHITSDQRT
jgi:hypothetical protein